MPPMPGPLPANYKRMSPSYHLFSFIIIVAWSLFILVTLITHELAHRATWDFDRIAAREGLPWIFSVLPNILRTVFDQGHGPITAMHLTRLAVDSLDTPWVSPNTWMEGFWLADRRWSGPVGLWTTAKTYISRKLRKLRGPHVSLGFCFFAVLSVVALVTPVTLSRAYHVTTSEVEQQIVVSDVSVVKIKALGEVTSRTYHQTRFGNSVWGRGMSPAIQGPENMYSEVGVPASLTSGSWLVTGGANKTIMQLSGIRVAGGCELLQPSNSTFGDICAAAFGDWSRNSSIVGQAAIDYGHMAVCSNISPNTGFGRDPRSNATSLFQIVTTLDDLTVESIVRCDVSAGAGNAFVNGRTMTFSNFTYIAPSEYIVGPQSAYMDPLAAIMQGDLNAYMRALAYKRIRDDVKQGDGQFDADPAWESELLWDGVVAMSVAVWLSTGEPISRPGIRKLQATGIQRNDGYFCVLGALLIVWFVGMFALSLAPMSSTWTSSLDGYAIARVLRQQPILAGTSEGWLTELEENEDMLQRFTMHDWRNQL